MPDTKHRNAHVEDVSEIEETRHTHKHKFSSKREKLEWYLDEIDCYKEDMGKWYTVLVRRIIPFLVFFIPINNLAFKLSGYAINHILGGVLTFDDVTFPLVVFFVALLLFILILIFLPRFATFCEFAMGIVWFILVFSNKLVLSTGLGYFVAVTLGIFLFMKLVFLVIEIIYLITFRGEREPKAYHGDENDIVL